MSPELEKLIDFRSGPDFPQWAKDGLTVRTTIHLSFWDRLKILCGWKLELDTFTATEEVVGRTETRSCVRVFNPRPRKSIAYVGEAEKAGS
jgi:hypothetical protein